MNKKRKLYTRDLDVLVEMTIAMLQATISNAIQEEERRAQKRYSKPKAVIRGKIKKNLLSGHSPSIRKAARVLGALGYELRFSLVTTKKKKVK